MNLNMGQIHASGNPVNVRLRESTGNEELDRAALEAVRNARYTASQQGRTGISQKITFEIQGSDYQRRNRQRREQEAIARSVSRQENRTASRQENRETSQTANRTASRQENRETSQTGNPTSSRKPNREVSRQGNRRPSSESSSPVIRPPRQPRTRTATSSPTTPIKPRYRQQQSAPPISRQRQQAATVTRREQRTVKPRIRQRDTTAKPGISPAAPASHR